MSSKFEARINIAIKFPNSKYEKTVAFYKDILKLEVAENLSKLLFSEDMK